MRRKKEGERKLQLDDCRCRATKKWPNGEEQRAERNGPDWGINMCSPNGRMTTLLHLQLDPPICCLFRYPPICTLLEKRMNEIKHSVVRKRTGFQAGILLILPPCCKLRRSWMWR